MSTHKRNHRSRRRQDPLSKTPVEPSPVEPSPVVGTVDNLTAPTFTSPAPEVPSLPVFSVGQNLTVEARLKAESSLSAKLGGIITHGVALKTRGRLYLQRGKQQWVAAVIMKLHPDLPPGLDANKLRGPVNKELKNDPSYNLPLPVSVKTINRALQNLYNSKRQGRL